MKRGMIIIKREKKIYYYITYKYHADSIVVYEEEKDLIYVQTLRGIRNTTFLIITMQHDTPRGFKENVEKSVPRRWLELLVKMKMGDNRPEPEWRGVKGCLYLAGLVCSCKIQEVHGMKCLKN